MNADSNMWISRRQALVWCGAVAVVLLLATGYYFGRGSGERGLAAEDSALIEEAQLDIAADTSVVRDLPMPKFKMEKKRLTKPAKTDRGPVSRKFLDEEVARP